MVFDREILLENETEADLMRLPRRVMVLSLGLCCLVAPAHVFAALAAPGLEPTGALAALRGAEKAAQDIWDRMPMAARRVAFVTGPVKQYGAYEPRGDNVFKNTEKVITYIEPVGFVFRDVGDGVLAYGFKVDCLVRKADGSVLMDKRDYATLDSRARSRRQEVKFDSSLDVADLAAGTYDLEFTFRDINSDKKMVVKQSFKVTR